MMLFSLDDIDSRSFRFGAVLAGGQSRRFGSPKALAPLGGMPLVEVVAERLQRAGVRPVAITAADSPPMDHLLPCRPDRVQGRGPLGGVFTALDWASELGVWGVLCVACDTPFLPVELLRLIADRGESLRDRVIVPESSADGAIEPLCAWYPTLHLSDVRLRLEMSALSLRDLIATLPAERIPYDQVSGYGDPATLFLNVNTPADGERAAALDATLRGPTPHG